MPGQQFAEVVAVVPPPSPAAKLIASDDAVTAYPPLPDAEPVPALTNQDGQSLQLRSQYAERSNDSFFAVYGSDRLIDSSSYSVRSSHSGLPHTKRVTAAETVAPPVSVSCEVGSYLKRPTSAVATMVINRSDEECRNSHG